MERTPKKTSWSTQWRAGLPFRGVLTGWKNGPTKSSLCSPKQMPSPILGTDKPHAAAHSGGYLSRKELWRKESGQPWWTTGLGRDSSVPPENGRAAYRVVWTRTIRQIKGSNYLPSCNILQAKLGIPCPALIFPVDTDRSGQNRESSAKGY